MHITFFSKDTKPEPWVSALRQQLPEARVEAWAAGADPADYAVVWAPPQEFLDAQPRLKGLFNIGAGVDALMQLRLPTGVPVVRLDDAGMSVQMAEYVCHAVIRYFRELDVYAEEAQQAHWAFRRPRVRADFTVGVMGLGVLGQRVAQALRGFEFPVVGWSRTPREVEGITCHAGAEGLSAFLGASQVLVNLLPLTPDTENILNRDTLAQLRTGAYVINVARGAHVVDADLLALLDSGHLAGATLDVFRTEPLPAEHPFWQHRRITVTPHTSARTLRDESVAQIVGKIRALERGEPITGVVDPLRGY
jgi:glyoxylate/hydroxypyruvate reductase A